MTVKRIRHGAGFIVPWAQGDNYMHLPRQFVPEEETKTPADGRSYETNGQSFGPVHRQQSSVKTGWELDQELQQGYAPELGMGSEKEIRCAEAECGKI